jgi:hypothetical protein
MIYLDPIQTFYFLGANFYGFVKSTNFESSPNPKYGLFVKSTLIFTMIVAEFCCAVDHFGTYIVSHENISPDRLLKLPGIKSER